MTAPHQTSPSANGAGNLFVEADPEQRPEPGAPARGGTTDMPRRGRGLVIPVGAADRAIPGSGAARFARPHTAIGRLSASARAALRAADVRAGALLRRLTARRYGALAAAAALAAMLLALSWLGLALRDAFTARHSAERARTVTAAVLTRDQERIAALNAQLLRAEANARSSQRASTTATAAWRARAMSAEHKLALNRHPRRR